MAMYLYSITPREHNFIKIPANKMSSNALEVVKEKVNGILEKYPVINQPLTNLSEKVKVDKVYLTLAIAAVPILLILALGTGHFIM